MLIDLKSKSLEAYLIDLESNNAKHNAWNATEYLKRPVKRIAPVEKANAFAEHLRGSFQFDPCELEALDDTVLGCW